jgi:hypothetical protein
MTDREFLKWIYARLVARGDDELQDFMHRFRDIIGATPRVSYSCSGPETRTNSMADLERLLTKAETA